MSLIGKLTKMLSYIELAYFYIPLTIYSLFALFCPFEEKILFLFWLGLYCKVCSPTEILEDFGKSILGKKK